jgi:hypothetical protein
MLFLGCFRSVWFAKRFEKKKKNERRKSKEKKRYVVD